MKYTADPLVARWRRFWRLPGSDRTVLVQATLLLPLTGLGLRVLGFRRWKKLLERVGTRSQPHARLPPGAALDQGRRIARAVHSAELHGPGKPNCLQRSIVLWWLLRREGVGAELHIGARKQSENFEAHAWVELNGCVLNDSADVHKHYSRFDAPVAASEADFH